MQIMRQRADFLAAAKALRAGRATLLMQLRLREDDGPPRFGFTASRKVGGAVLRNRAKRRLRAIASSLARSVPDHTDCVLIARPETVTAPFASLEADARSALGQLMRKLNAGAAPHSKGDASTAR